MGPQKRENLSQLAGSRKSFIAPVLFMGVNWMALVLLFRSQYPFDLGMSFCAFVVFVNALAWGWSFCRKYVEA